MARTRVTRSKTGCQACRRRKVRCDEIKPTCSACGRLNLTCAYGPAVPGSSRSTPETSKYRVRFVSSPYLKPALQPSSAGDPQPVPAALPGRSLEALSPPGSDIGPGFGTPASIEHQTRAGQHVEGGSHVAPADRIDAEHASCAVITSQQDAPTSWNPAPSMPLMGVAAPTSFPNATLQDDQHQPGVFLPQDLASNDTEGAMGVMSMPAFFDLNMNFDSLSEDWMAFPSSPAQRPVPRPALYREEDIQSPSSDTSGVVSISPTDHGLIQHYLNVMSQYTKLRGSGDENIYTQIFSNMALFYAPLYHAIMAWTAMHLGQSKRQAHLIHEAGQRNSRAVLLMHQDQEIAHHLELALVTIWFALQFELLAARGIDSFCHHLEFAADLIDTHRRQARVNERFPTLNPLSSRVLLWLGTYDARASWIGGTGRLLQSLELFRFDFDFLDAAFPDATGATNVTSLSDLKSSLRSNLDFDMLDNRIALLHRRVITAPAAIWSQVRSDLLSVQERLEASSPTTLALERILTKPSRVVKGKITTKLFNNLLLLSACYSLIIEFHRLVPASVVDNLEPSRLISGEVAADRIIRISAWVCRLRPPSPQNIWPRILFLAGIETTDVIHQDWVLRTLSESERWGGNFVKTRALLDHILKEQSNEGARIDYVDAMKRFTGLFII